MGAFGVRNDGQVKKAVELLEHVVAVEVTTFAEGQPEQLEPGLLDIAR